MSKWDDQKKINAKSIRIPIIIVYMQYFGGVVVIGKTFAAEKNAPLSKLIWYN